MKFLVVDDAAAVRDLLARLLPRIGVQVATCGNGREALQLLAEEPGPELVITDWEMPEMDGPELIRQLRRTDRYRRVPVILLSGRGNVDRAVARDCGADDFLAKPFRWPDLAAMIAARFPEIRVQDTNDLWSRT